jgi:proline racemase
MRFNRLLSAIDAHTVGNPERVVIGGAPMIPGKTMLEKAKYVRHHLDHLRTLLVDEPRGHGNMYASFLVPPTTEQADYGVIFMENGGYPTMCGHATIAICTVLVEAGFVEPQEPETVIVLDTPAGLVRAQAAVKDGKAQSVTFKNVPSFLYNSDVKVDVPNFGLLTVDIAYGGNFYAILPVESVGLHIAPEYASELVILGTQIWQTVNEQVSVQHPEKPEINCVNFVEFSGPSTHPGVTIKNAVVAPPLGMDRSPCGTGTCAKMATLHAKGELALNQQFVHESIIGTLFYGELIEETQVGEYRAVVPTIRGSAYIMGIQHFVLDPEDPFPAGFFLGKRDKLYGFEF